MPIRSTAPLAVAVALLAALPGCDPGAPAPGAPGAPAAQAAPPPEDALAVAVGPVARRAIAQTYVTSTTLSAEQEATVIARTIGVVRRLHAEEGDRVSSGAPLAELEDEEQQIALARARLARESRQRELERQGQLRERDLISAVELEQAEIAARDAVEAERLAELELSRTVIRAPFGGVVLRRHLDVGASVASGTQVYDLADMDPLLAQVRIPERQVGGLAPGQEARVTVGEAAEPLTGEVLRIAPLVDPASGTVTVTVAVPGRPGLRPGAFARVAVVTDRHEDARVVPRSALVADGRRWRVYVLAEDGRTVTGAEIALGFEEADQVEILPAEGAPPLSDVAQVVTVGAAALSDGARVSVQGAGDAAGGGADVAP